MKPRRPIVRRKGPVRRTPPKRLLRPRFKAGRDRAFLDWLCGHQCEVNRDCRGRVDPAHVRSRGAGGVDVGNAVPLCRLHHEEQGRTGIRTFQAKYGLNMKARAAHFERAWGYDQEVRRRQLLAREATGDLAHPAPQDESPPHHVK